MRRARTLAVLAILLGGAVGIIGSTQPWIDVTLRDASHPVLTVAGADASPLLAPLSLAALALGLALSIAGPVLRYLFGVLAVAIGAAITVAAARIQLALPVDAYAPTVTDATGLSGDAAVSALIETVALTAWPAATASAAAIGALGGAFTLAGAHRWPASGRRYAAASDAAAGTPRATSRPHDAIDDWDDLSRGEDPTDTRGA